MYALSKIRDYKRLLLQNLLTYSKLDNGNTLTTIFVWLQVKTRDKQANIGFFKKWLLQKDNSNSDRESKNVTYCISRALTVDPTGFTESGLYLAWGYKRQRTY